MKKLSHALSLIAALGLVTAGMGLTDADISAWRMYGAGSRHTFSTTETIQLPLKVDWEYKTGGGYFSQSGAISHRGMYIIPLAGGKLSAVYENSGKEVWSHEYIGERLISSPTPANDYIVVATQSGKISVLLASNGTVKWTFDAGSDMQYPPMVYGGTVFAVTDSGLVLKLTLRGLYTLGTSNLLSPLSAQPALGLSGLCVATSDGNLTMLDRNLVKVWTNKIDGVASGTVCISKNNAIVINKRGMINSFDMATGKSSWMLNIGNDCPSGMIDDDYQVYAVSLRGNIFAIDAANGESNWMKRIDGDVVGRPTVTAGKLYISTINKQVFCFAASDGSQLWTSRVDHETVSGLSFSTRTMLVLPRVGSGYCFALNNGEKLWSFDTGGIGRIPPVTDGSKVCATFSDGSVKMLDSKSGQLLWNRVIGSQINSPPAMAGDRIITGTSDETIFSLDASNGKTLWKTYVPYYVNSAPAITGKYLFVGTWGGEVYSIDVNNGQKQWSQPTNAEIKTSPSVSTSNVYVGSWDSNIYSYDYLTGTQLWKMSTPYNLNQCISLGSDQGYIPTKDQLMCVKLRDGVPLWFAKLDSNVVGELAINEDSIVALTNAGFLYKFNGKGTKVWSRKVETLSTSRSITIFGDYICLTTGTQVKFFDIGTGRLKWQYDCDYPVSQPIFSSGRLYLTTDIGSVICLVYDRDAIMGAPSQNLDFVFP